VLHAAHRVGHQEGADRGTADHQHLVRQRLHDDAELAAGDGVAAEHGHHHHGEAEDGGHAGPAWRSSVTGDAAVAGGGGLGGSSGSRSAMPVTPAMRASAARPPAGGGGWRWRARPKGPSWCGPPAPPGLPTGRRAEGRGVGVAGDADGVAQAQRRLGHGADGAARPLRRQGAAGWRTWAGRRPPAAGCAGPGARSREGLARHLGEAGRSAGCRAAARPAASKPACSRRAARRPGPGR
jgi:hypothetical protein